MAEVTRLVTGTCRRGHRLTSETAVVRLPSTRRPNGSLVCKVCRRIRQRLARAGLPPMPRTPAQNRAAQATGSAVQRAESRLEEIEFMVEGVTRVDGVAARLGSTDAATARFLYRRGRPDLARKFDRVATRERKAA